MTRETRKASKHLLRNTVPSRRKIRQDLKRIAVEFTRKETTKDKP
jgi:hypothetical protein